MFETVIRNIISNAIKYSSINGKILIDVTRLNTNFVQIKITDNGIGIEGGDLKKIMTDHSISTKGTKNEQGTGLGLELCKEFINKNGGKLTINSEVNIGTTVVFTIPCYPQ